MARNSYEFFDGPISDRIVNAIKECSVAAIIDLDKAKVIRLNKETYTLNYRSLKPENLSQYCKITGYSARYFLFGSENQVLPGFLEEEKEIFPLINALDAQMAKKVLSFMETFYPNRFYDNCSCISRPSSRLASYFSILPKGTITFSDIEKNAKISVELEAELKRFRVAGQSKLFIFDSNMWFELAQYSKVSLHWMLGLTVPLFFNNQSADIIFDRYALMSAQERESFHKFMSEVVKRIPSDKEAIIQL